jgi:DNA-binding HxlR family transcriptional regulator
MTRESRPGWLRPSSTPRLQYQADPLGQSVRRLDKKWTLLILRDIAFLHLDRFTEFLRNNPGLTPRVLSRRLREMQVEGLVTRAGTGKGVTYALTPRGQDAVYILLAFLKYGLKHHAGAEMTSRAS